MGKTAGGLAYDWHHFVLARTLQQHMLLHLLPEPSLFSTVQLYRQSNKLYGPVFTGAYDALVSLTAAHERVWPPPG